MAERQCNTTVLVAEDPFIRAFIHTYLSRHGYEVICADSATGKEKLRSGERRIDVLITNQPEIFADAAARTPLLYIAASPDPSKASVYRRCRMLRKPFHPQHMLAALADLLAETAVAE